MIPFLAPTPSPTIYPSFERLFREAQGDARIVTAPGTPEEANVAFLRGDRKLRAWCSPLDFGIGFEVDRPVSGRCLAYADGIVSLDLASRGLTLHVLRQEIGRAGICDVWRFLDRHGWRS